MFGPLQLVPRGEAEPHPIPEPASHLDETVVARLERLCERLQLAPAERHVLVTCVAIAVSPSAGVILQQLQHEPAGVGVRVHAFARWTDGDGTITRELAMALAPDGLLVRAGLVERLDPAPTPLAFERWFAPRAVIAYAVGIEPPIPDGEEDPALAPEVVARIGNAIMRAGSLRIVARDRRELVHDAAIAIASLGARIHAATAPVPTAAIRDAMLANAVLAIEVLPAEDASDRGLRATLADAARLAVPVILLAGAAGDATGLADSEIAIEPPPPDQRTELWRAALYRQGVTVEGHVLGELGDAFAIARGPIERAAARLATAGIARASSLAVGAALADEMPHAVGALGDFEALPRPGELDWASLHAPDETLEEIALLLQRCRYRRHVFDDMGLSRFAGSRGVVALFHGPPGTGKTLATKLIATQLGLRLLRIDASRLVSKWIGETEKNLKAILDAAEDGRFALLFDEADALFGKRSTENKGGTDRYANMEINYLLQRLDRFDGIAFLTSNHEAAIDDAFRRRLAARIEFPIPNEVTRERLWRALAPAHVALDRAQLVALARPELAGGNIKNAVLRGAFIAAGQGRALDAKDLARGLELELRAAGKLA